MGYRVIARTALHVLKAPASTSIQIGSIGPGEESVSSEEPHTDANGATWIWQTCFQTLSCRQLSEAESYLDVDYQIGCHEDGYQRFRNTVGRARDLRLPDPLVLSLLLLLKNNSDI
jgi:hypothetical protein